MWSARRVSTVIRKTRRGAWGTVVVGATIAPFVSSFLPRQPAARTSRETIQRDFRSLDGIDSISADGRCYYRGESVAAPPRAGSPDRRKGLSLRAGGTRRASRWEEGRSGRPCGRSSRRASPGAARGGCPASWTWSAWRPWPRSPPPGPPRAGPGVSRCGCRGAPPCRSSCGPEGSATQGPPAPPAKCPLRVAGKQQAGAADLEHEHEAGAVDPLLQLHGEIEAGLAVQLAIVVDRAQVGGAAGHQVGGLRVALHLLPGDLPARAERQPGAIPAPLPLLGHPQITPAGRRVHVPDHVGIPGRPQDVHESPGQADGLERLAALGLRG